MKVNIKEIGVDDLLCFSLYSTNNAMNKVYNPLLKEFGLTYPQLIVFISLWEKDGQLVGDLGRTLYLESNTLTPMLKRLEQRGYLVRKRSQEDERQVRIWLTAEAQELRNNLGCISEKILEATGLSIEELIEIREKLNLLRTHLVHYNSK